MNIEEFQDIKYQKDDETGIVTVTLATPKRKNAMSFLTFLELWYATDMVEKDDTAQAMLITGAKDPDESDPSKEAFSSGGFFSPTFLKTVPPQTQAEIDFTDIAQKRLTLKMWKCEKPIVAAINGLAIGAGFTLPLACADFIFMSEHAYVRLPFVRLGILPEFSSAYLLPRLIGFQRAKEICYLGKTLSAKEVYDLGLINAVLPHGELLPHAKKIIMELIPPGGPILAIKLTKRAMHKPLIESITKSLDIENEGLNKAILTHDFMEAGAARKEKRKPVYKGA